MHISSCHYTNLPLPLIDWVQNYLRADTRRRFRNWSHVSRVYTWADSLGFHYDPAFDLAAAFHDAEITQTAGKEKCCELMRRVVPDYMSVTSRTLDAAAALIMSTDDHVPTSDNRLILCDLADFSVQLFMRLNMDNSMYEALALNPSMTKVAYYRSTLRELRALRNNLESKDYLWGEHAALFTNVAHGISTAIHDVQLAYADTCK